MLGDLLSNLQEARKRIEESKKKLNDIIIESSVDNGSIRVKANANKTLCEIYISDHLIDPANKERLVQLLVQGINKALEEAAVKGEEEMKQITRDMLPNFPGLI